MGDDPAWSTTGRGVRDNGNTLLLCDTQRIRVGKHHKSVYEHYRKRQYIWAVPECWTWRFGPDAKVD